MGLIDAMVQLVGKHIDEVTDYVAKNKSSISNPCLSLNSKIPWFEDGKKVSRVYFDYYFYSFDNFLFHIVINTDIKLRVL